MRIKTVAVSYARKFNLGNYEAAEISVSLWSEVEPEEDEEGVIAYLFETCKEQVKAQVPPSYKRGNLSYAETFTKFGKAISKDESMAFDAIELNQEDEQS